MQVSLLPVTFQVSGQLQATGLKQVQGTFVPLSVPRLCMMQGAAGCEAVEASPEPVASTPPPDPCFHFQSTNRRFGTSSPAPPRRSDGALPPEPAET